MPPKRRTSRSASRSRARSKSQTRARSGSRSAAKPANINPTTTSFEWSGPIGAFGIVHGLPLLVITLNSLCGDASVGCSASGVVANVAHIPQILSDNFFDSLPHIPLAIGIELVWLAIHALLYLAPIGARVPGLPLRDGSQLIYNINAIHAFIISHATLFGLHGAGVIDLAFVADMFSPLMYGAIAISIVMSVILYAASFRSPSSPSKPVLLALGGNSGKGIYDFWVGRELNPFLGPIDLKFMCELRPGLIGWSIINWSFVIQSFATYQSTHSGSVGDLVQSFLWTQPNIVLIALFESFYVFDGLLLEAGNITMMDIVHDGFGFMLCFGDLTWVPFTYTLKTKYLAATPYALHPAYLTFCIIVYIAGYAIFRGANTEKDRFRKDPNDPRVAYLQTMETSKGKQLIISGFWGICRHPNYVGDWMMTMSLSMLTGGGALLPYFQPVYFLTLLIHRQLRDEEQMQIKYGARDWKKFCDIVKYRLIPYIY